MTKQPTIELEPVELSTVQLQETDWLKRDFIPCRSLTLIAGREGIGKSLIACDYIAQATRGEFDNGEPLNCLYIQSYDSYRSTVPGRLTAAGADRKKILFPKVTPTRSGGEIVYDFEFPRDFDGLQQLIEERNIGVVVLDPVESFMSVEIDGNRAASVRKVLDPINRIADETNCAFIGIVYFGKRASSDIGKRISGSIAWSQSARSILSVTRAKDGTLFVTNAKRPPAAAEVTEMAHIESAIVACVDGEDSFPRIVWDGQINYREPTERDLHKRNEGQ